MKSFVILVVPFSIFLLYLLYYAEMCIELALPISTSLRPGQHILSKKCRNGGEPLATVCPISLAQDLNLEPPAPETNALPLNQQKSLFQ